MIDTKTLQTAAQNLSEKLSQPIAQTSERGKQFVNTVQGKSQEVISGVGTQWTSLSEERRTQITIGAISVLSALVVAAATILTVRFFQGRN